MLIRALCDYYDTLASQGKVILDGFSQIDVSYMISLKSNGEIDDISDIRDNGKRRKVKIIEREGKTSISSEKIEHRGLYIFGLNYDSKSQILTPNDDKNAAQKKHKAFIDTNLEFIDGIDSPIVNAFRNFIILWNPEKGVSNPLIMSIGKEIESASFIFCLSGYPEILLHEDKGILDRYFNSEKVSTDVVESQCAVLGEKQEIARVHNKIKGILGGQPSGTVLVCYKNDSENSYGNEQSFNSNISEIAMKKYTEALNYLLESKLNHQYIDDTTIIYWVQNGNEKADDLMSMLAFDDDGEGQIDDDMLSSLVSDCKKGAIVQEKLLIFQDLDLNTDYYFVGIKPNSSRLSMKFIYRKKLGDFLLNSAQHQIDLKIIGLEKSVPLWKLKKELLSQKSKNESVNPALLAKIFESILNGTAYPDELLQKVILRVKNDTDQKISPTRAGIIKACLIRKNRLNKKEEDISMSLDKENTNHAYLCGRLFAVLEQIQQKSSNYSLNRTIKDSYFASAASRPASIFPKIIKLANYHLSKLGNPKYFIDDISEITEKLGNEFPITLSLSEQGKFILGYYHQTNNKKNKAEEK